MSFQARLCAALTAALAFAFSPAASAQQGFSSDAVARIAGACSADGAFGARFGERSSQMHASHAGWAPIGLITLRRTPSSQRLHVVEAVAELADAAAASAFVAALESRVSADGRFSRKPSQDEDEIVFEGAGGVRLELSALGRGAYITCVKPDLQQLALDESLGRVRIERPTPPQLRAPPRPAAGVCNDASTRARFVADFQETALGAVEYGDAIANHTSNLQTWYGQQLKGKGAWSEQDETSFAFRVLEDRVVAAEVKGSIDRLPGFIQNLLQFAQASERGGGEAQACAAALRALDDIEAMGRSAQVQWRRVEEIYRAEAVRLNVTFD
jgi:hypothetical protein